MNKLKITVTGKAKTSKSYLLSILQKSLLEKGIIDKDKKFEITFEEITIK